MKENKATVMAAAAVRLPKQICLSVQLNRSFLDFIRDESSFPNKSLIRFTKKEDDNDVVLQSRSLVLLATPTQKKEVG